MDETSLVYLDTNATTPIADPVIDVISRSLKEEWGNASSKHSYGLKAKQAIQRARYQVSEMIQAKPSEIVFMSGGTEANHTVLEIFSSSCPKKVKHLYETSVGDQPNNNINNDELVSIPHIVTSEIEHDSIKRPLEKMVLQKRLSVTYVPVNPSTFMVDVADVMKAIQPSTVLVSIMLANNETGKSAIGYCYHALSLQ